MYKKFFTALTICLQTVWLTTGGLSAADAPLTAGISKNADGEQALDNGDNERAKQIFTNALAAGKLPDDQEAYLRTGLAEACLWLGQFAECKGQLAKASKLADKSDTYMRGRIFEDQSWLDEAQGKSADALANCQKALELREADKEKDGLSYVNSLAHLAYLNETSGKFEESIAAYGKVLAAYEKFAGPNTPVAGDMKEKQASLYWKLGKKDDSLRLFSEALQYKNALGAVWQPYSPHPYWENVVFRYYEGAPNCTKQFSQGSSYELVTADGITVLAALVQDKSAAKSVRIDLTISNDSARPVDFLSNKPSLVVLSPKLIIAQQLDSASIASKVETKGDRKAAWTRFWGQNATQTLTTTVYNGGGNWGFAPVYGGYPGGWPGNYNRSGNMSFINQQVPDYAAQARALQKAADITQQAHTKADDIRSKAIGASRIEAGQSLSGSLYFAADKADKVVVRLPVGNSIFEFQLPPK